MTARSYRSQSRAQSSPSSPSHAAAISMFTTLLPIPISFSGADMLPLVLSYNPKGTTMSTAADLTSTSYALLGLLAIKPWTTYELAKQMDRTLSRFWPRARSKLYEEPKKLVAHGLARATEDVVGKRRR